MTLIIVKNLKKYDVQIMLVTFLRCQTVVGNVSEKLYGKRNVCLKDYYFSPYDITEIFLVYFCDNIKPFND